MAQPLIVNTARGLFCPPGDFFIDAWGDVARNIVTHAHSDHARRGSQRYLCPTDGVALLRQRLGHDIAVDPLAYGKELDLNGVRVSLHPAGHVLGSAQVRVEHGGEVWVFTGDYKRHPDVTCRGFELVRCHTFITECTFGLPIFRWKDPQILTEEVNRWWRENVADGRTSALFAYSLGKAQRLVGTLDPSIGPILLHGAVDAITNAYRETGVTLPPTEYASVEAAKQYRGRAMVIAPPSALGSVWLRKFSPVSTGVASGWMQVRGFRRRGGADRGFVLSDHADFPQLLSTIAQTGAERVIATHGFTEPLVRLLRERGLDASSFKTRFKGEEEESELPSEERAELRPGDAFGQPFFPSPGYTQGDQTEGVLTEESTEATRRIHATPPPPQPSPGVPGEGVKAPIPPRSEFSSAETFVPSAPRSDAKLFPSPGTLGEGQGGGGLGMGNRGPQFEFADGDES